VRQDFANLAVHFGGGSMQTALEAVLFALMVLFMLAWMVAFWVQRGTIRDARQSGHRYWFVNPLAILAGYRAMNWNLYLWSMFAMFLIAAIIVVILFTTGHI
jgi:hypothetical protein